MSIHVGPSLVPTRQTSSGGCNNLVEIQHQLRDARGQHTPLQHSRALLRCELCPGFPISHCAPRPRLFCRLERALLLFSLSDLCSRLVVAQNCYRLYIYVFVLTLFVLFWYRCSWSMLPLSRWSVHRGHPHCRRIWKSCVVIPLRAGSLVR